MTKYWILSAVFCLAVFSRSPSLCRPHFESDELIYEILAEKLSVNFFDYSLQGSDMLKTLEPSVYDKPIFHHPPLFVMMFSLVRGLGRQGETSLYTKPIQLRAESPEKLKLAYRSYGGAGLSLLLFLAGLFLTVLIGRKLYDLKVGIVAALVLVVCPITWLCSTKIWIDNLLFATVSLAVLIHLISAQKQTSKWFFISGLSIGIALLSKYTAIVILPVLFLIYFFNDRKILLNRKIAFYAIGCCLVFLPWIIVFYSKTGLFYPYYIKPSPEFVAENAFVASAVNQPFYYYFWVLLVISPLYLLTFPQMFIDFQKKENLICSIWVISFLLVFTGIGLFKGGYQARFILPAFPGFALLASKTILSSKKKLVLIFASVFAMYSLYQGYLLAIKYQFNDTNLKQSKNNTSKIWALDIPEPTLLYDLGVLKRPK